jgi:hypothetical protein
MLPAISLAQTIHKKKDQIVYEGKIETTGDSYNRSQSFLLSDENADSVKDDKDKKALTAVIKLKLPSTYHLQEYISYKVKLHPTADTIEYEINDVQLASRERGEKLKVLSSQELLKGMGESGNTARDAEKVLNEMDMYIQLFIARMQSALVYQ